VAKSFVEMEGFHLEEEFAPIIRMTTIRLVFMVAIKFHGIHVYDIF